MDDTELRFSCLQLANQNGGRAADEIVEAAGKFYEFAMGLKSNPEPAKKKGKR